MDAVGISTQTKMDIYRVAAAVLHLGNVEFQENTKDKKGDPEVLRYKVLLLSVQKK